MPKCYECKRQLVVGESAWASDWSVLPVQADETGRVEIRYTCDGCMSELGFCPTDGEAMPCFTCGAGL